MTPSDSHYAPARSAAENKGVLRRLLLVATLTALPSAALSPILLTAGADARRIDPAMTKNGNAVKQAVAPATNGAAEATVRFYRGDEPASLGACVREDGVVLTKASELGDTIRAKLADGREVGGRLIGVSRELDLAAVKLDVDHLPTIEWGDESDLHVGQWLATVGPDKDTNVVAVGNLSLEGIREVPPTAGLLGVAPESARAGIPVARVLSGSAADIGGLEEGDLIMAVNGVPVGTRRDFVRGIASLPPNATILLTVARDGMQVKRQVTLQNGQLGIGVAREAVGVRIRQVVPGSGAEAAGLRAGDLITAIDGEPMTAPTMLFRALGSRAAGSTVQVTFLRDGRKQTVEAEMGYRSGRNFRAEFQNELGGRLSKRAVDFPAVLQHDTILDPEEVGGPLVTLEGKAVGLNIARAGRTETYALPAAVIREVLPELLSGAYDPATQPATTPEGEAAPQPRMLGR